MGIKKLRASDDFSDMSIKYMGALLAFCRWKEEVAGELGGLEAVC